MKRDIGKRRIKDAADKMGNQIRFYIWCVCDYIKAADKSTTIYVMLQHVVSVEKCVKVQQG